MTQPKIINQGKLISRHKWVQHIQSLQSKSAEIVKNEESIAQQISNTFSRTIQASLPRTRVGVLFSGGLDSSLIAYTLQSHNAKFVCYTVGVEKSSDIDMAVKVANYYNWELRYKIFSQADLEKLFVKTSQILGQGILNVVNLGVGAVEIAVQELAKRDNIYNFYSGLGSEEIFAGYQRHELAKDINEECWSGLKSMWERDLLREARISKFYKINLITPFLDEGLIELAMSIEGRLKIQANCKKYILRKAALCTGLKKEFALRKKIAAQYGSGFDKMMFKIAKLNGYPTKKDYLNDLGSM